MSLSQAVTPTSSLRGQHRTRKTIAGEAADLIFHLQVALAHHVVKWRLVQEVLAGA